MSASPESSATLLDVARLAGVGKATASRVLNRTGSVSVDTRRKVLEAAEQLHYQVNAVSKRLAALRWRQQDPAQLRGRFACLDMVPDPWALAAEPIRTQANALGYDVEFVHFDPAREQALLRELWHRGVEGVLIRSHGGRFPVIQSPWLDRMHLVVVGEHPAYPVTHVSFDFAAAAYLVYDKLRERGFRRIGYWQSSSSNSTHSRMSESVFHYLRAKRARRDGTALFWQDQPRATVDAEAISRWIAKNRLEALVVGASAWLERLRRELGEAMPAIECVSLTEPRIPVTHVNHRFGRIAEEAVRILVGEMLRGLRQVERRHTTILLKPEWCPAGGGSD